ncbi:uncharacterized protein EV420DRAFT_1637763 [Desarmillaria tabescens]|uniref:Survival motor neuron Tudor domain-containing protein n=1 Tax=Armillaria tabescens TaxID=1929756 RepID=A0AA39NEL6_ARMTA|nr:uncharacterized protein EV420DRAFT_1637763 [Desarmillaria tabescens]KAK0464199.1 hypothetical protein EV420DRAFT_1637763 [Desarmillaria tabescens]
MRPVVSYDDIASVPTSQPPPAKKRKANHNTNRNQRNRKRSRNEEESRELTHDEIWDDSALIDAWAAANEEYAAYHGGDDKSWKNESTELPPDEDNSKTDLEPPLEDSQPLNVLPSHDPSLSSVSQDEAFQRAMNSMYWAGYWTAVYHHQRRLAEEEEDEEGEGKEDKVEVEEDLVSTQR